MTNRLFTQFVFVAILFLSAGVAMAQHDMGGGGTTSGAATGGATSSSRTTTTVKRPPRRTPPARTTPPPRRGITAEQFNAQGDDLFKAKNYDDALEAYQRAVALKPLASAYYHIGWIYNERDFDSVARVAASHATQYGDEYALTRWATPIAS
jgi:tetratricopeptide (TPR) repeat protein